MSPEAESGVSFWFAAPGLGGPRPSTSCDATGRWRAAVLGGQERLHHCGAPVLDSETSSLHLSPDHTANEEPMSRNRMEGRRPRRPNAVHHFGSPSPDSVDVVPPTRVWRATVPGDLFV